MITYIYWIHYPSHTDPFTEGYVGVSNDPEHRFTIHKKHSKDNSYLKRAINRGAIQTILHQFDTREEALISEELYRPTGHIGWNIIPGGINPPPQKGLKNPNVSESNKNRVVSSETRKKMSERRKTLKWYNNGKKNIRSTECPEGFVEGRGKINFSHNSE